jgi:dTDP-4-dehydrorhamnose 3,5-epimerase
MKIIVEREALNGAMVLRNEVFEDARGFFLEAYRADMYKDLGIDQPFVQDNHSGSVKNVVRGLHFQWQPQMAKLMRVTRGEAFLVAVDIRKNSPTLGQWIGEFVSERNRRQVWAPAGFARGFCVLSDYAEIQYKCTGIYNNGGESGILWNDPKIGIEWPAKNPILSDKDAKAQTLEAWLKTSESDNFKF